jgi:hypothetical protein
LTLGPVDQINQVAIQFIHHFDDGPLFFLFFEIGDQSILSSTINNDPFLIEVWGNSVRAWLGKGEPNTKILLG